MLLSWWLPGTRGVAYVMVEVSRGRIQWIFVLVFREGWWWWWYYSKRKPSRESPSRAMSEIVDSKWVVDLLYWWLMKYLIEETIVAIDAEVAIASSASAVEHEWHSAAATEAPSSFPWPYYSPYWFAHSACLVWLTWSVNVVVAGHWVSASSLARSS